MNSPICESSVGEKEDKAMSKKKRYTREQSAAHGKTELLEMPVEYKTGELTNEFLSTRQ